jgi:hypothetical protein
MIGIVLYVYSPLLDHWLGHKYYARPHTHIHLPENIVTLETEGHFSENDDHEEDVVCVLDIEALFFIVLIVYAPLIIQNAPLIFDLFPYYLQSSTISLSSLDPPPRIHA